MCNPYQPINKRGTVVFKPDKTFLFFCQLIIIVVVSALIYLYTLGNDFAYDDKFTITNNYLIRSWHKIPTIFTNDYFTSSGELSYRPVVTLSYFIDYFFWQLNPLGYHLTNLLLHSLNSVFLFFPEIIRIFLCVLRALRGELLLIFQNCIFWTTPPRNRSFGCCVAAPGCIYKISCFFNGNHILSIIVQ